MNCVIANNKADHGGGIGGKGVSSHRIFNSQIVGNNSYGPGGGLYLAEGSGTPKIVNTLIARNTDTNAGGGIYTDGSNITLSLIDSTVAYNSSSWGGGLSASYGVKVLVHNTIIWGNTATGGAQIYAYNMGTGIVEVRYSDVAQGSSNIYDPGSRVDLPTSGQGNLGVVPSFVDIDGGDNDPLTHSDNDYRLASNSACMDAGDNNRVSLDEVDLDFDENVDERVPVDLDDKLRFVDAPESDTGLTAPDYPKIVDMGAYENQGCTTDPDCDDDDPCNGVESCANGLCVVDFQNCNHNGIDDRCELAVIVDWKSIVTHGASNTIGLVIPSDNTFSESRNGGVTKLRLSFSSPIDADSVSPSNVTICGNDVNDQSVNLSGITVTTSVLSGNAAVDISFSPKLPNYARYRVRLNGVEDLACNTITTNNERVFTSLFGDITGDRRVNATDVGGVRSLVPKYTIDPNITPEVRSDVDNDNDIDDNDHTPPDSDVGLVRAEIPKDARYIADPTCP